MGDADEGKSEGQAGGDDHIQIKTDGIIIEVIQH